MTNTHVKLDLKCTTCGRNLVSEKVFVHFPCPQCGDKEIVRCEHCKIHSNKFTCDKCGFEGP